MPKPNYEWQGHWNTRTELIMLNSAWYKIEYDLDVNQLALYYDEFFNYEHEAVGNKPLVTISLTELPSVNDAIKLLANAFAEQMLKLAEENENA